MGIGVTITSGKGNTELPFPLINNLTEVRVEQSLDDPTSFAIMFAEEFDDAGPVLQD